VSENREKFKKIQEMEISKTTKRKRKAWNTSSFGKEIRLQVVAAMQTSLKTTGEGECDDDPWNDENGQQTPSKKEDITMAMSKINRANLCRKVYCTCSPCSVVWF